MLGDIPMKLTFRYKGGKGSGHHGHAGRPGKEGGSLPGIGITAAERYLRSEVGNLVDNISPKDIADFERGLHSVEDIIDIALPAGRERNMVKLDHIAGKLHGFKKEPSFRDTVKYSKKTSYGNNVTIRITETDNPMLEVNLRGADMFRKSFPFSEIHSAMDYANKLVESDSPKYYE
jgi:hypothetical protein